MDVAGEALRYLGAAGDRGLRPVAEELLAMLETAAPPRWTWKAFPLSTTGDRYALGDLVLSGDTAGKMLETCDAAVLLLCSLGARFDALLRSWEARDMARAVVLDACGSALVEQGCDAAEQEIRSRFPGRFLTDRFSPGYGDLPLSLQPEVCAALDGGRRLGVQAMESFLLNPSKTVTAVIGLSDRPQKARIRGCGCCAMRDTCAVRRGGGRCGQ